MSMGKRKGETGKMPYYITTENRRMKEKIDIEKAYDTVRSTREENTTDWIWESLGNLKQLQGIEENL